MMSVATSGRKMPRARLALPIVLSAKDFHIDGETLNVSPGGCALLLDHEPPRGEIRFSLQLPDSTATGTARVVSCIEYGGKFYVSLAFARLESLSRPQLIDAVLRALESGS